MDTNLTLESSRLILRCFNREDAQPMQKYGNSEEISRILAAMPHPYTLQHAYDWIARQENRFRNDYSYTLAITEKTSGTWMGTIEMFCDPANRSAGIGYWLGVPFWNQGFCTEAVRLMLDFGFAEKGFHRIWAEHWALNPASGRVMQKCGMRKEAVKMDAELVNGEYRDMVYYAILRREWEEQKRRFDLREK